MVVKSSVQAEIEIHTKFTVIAVASFDVLLHCNQNYVLLKAFKILHSLTLMTPIHTPPIIDIGFFTVLLDPNFRSW